MTAFGKSKWVKELPEKLTELSQKRFVERVFLNSLWDELLLTVFGLFVVVLMPIYFKLNKVAAVGGDGFWWVPINVCLNFERLLIGVLLLNLNFGNLIVIFWRELIVRLKILKFGLNMERVLRMCSKNRVFKGLNLGNRPLTSLFLAWMAGSMHSLRHR